MGAVIGAIEVAAIITGLLTGWWILVILGCIGLGIAFSEFLGLLD